MESLALIEKATGQQAWTESALLQAGDRSNTADDITAIIRDFGFVPSTEIEVGVPRFLDWSRCALRQARARAEAVAAK